MKILWNDNPLKTAVELNDEDKKLLREKLRVDYLEECLVAIHCAVDPQHNKGKTPEEMIAEVAKTADLDYLFDGTERNNKTLDQCLDDRLAIFVAELLGEHCGDCTCVPASCAKCYAENLLGVDTTQGLGKHAGYNVHAAFTSSKGSLPDAIAYLENYDPVFSEGKGGWKSKEDFDRHVPRWKKDAELALVWLKKYAKEKR